MAILPDSYEALQKVKHSQRAVKNVKARIQPPRPGPLTVKQHCNCKEKLLGHIPTRGDLSKSEKTRMLAVVQEFL